MELVSRRGVVLPAGINERLGVIFEVRSGGGVRIKKVIDGSPCVGLVQEGEVLSAVNGHNVSSEEDVVTRANISYGPTVTLSLFSEERTMSFKKSSSSVFSSPTAGAAGRQR